jgi:dipeptidyl aminopeptidase/acylaminoacyl peptidase
MQVLYPGEAHVFNRPAHQIDVLTRVAAWFDRYLKPASGETD